MKDELVKRLWKSSEALFTKDDLGLPIFNERGVKFALWTVVVILLIVLYLQ